MAASVLPSKSRRLLVMDKDTKVQFLVDTGTDLCVYARSRVCGRRKKADYDLYAANGSIIPTCGSETLNLNLGLRRAFTWRFVVADVTKPIIGVDFLHHFALLVNIRNQCLIENLTSLFSKGKVSQCPEEHLGIRAVSGINPAKCSWGESSVRFLGYEVSEKGIKPLPERIQSILDFPQPKTTKQLRQFLGIFKFL